MKKLLTLIAALVMSIALSGAAQACPASQPVTPTQFRHVSTSDTRWHTQHVVFHNLGKFHNAWTGDDGFRYQQRRYHSSWDRYTQVRVTYVRLSPDSHFLVVRKQWCNKNDFNPVDPNILPHGWICKSHVWA